MDKTNKKIGSIILGKYSNSLLNIINNATVQNTVKKENYFEIYFYNEVTHKTIIYLIRENILTDAQKYILNNIIEYKNNLNTLI